MVVRTINNELPDFSGNININFTGALYDASGLVDKQIKMWTGTTTTVADGLWSIDYSSAGFTHVLSIQTEIESATTVAADKPLGGYVSNKSLVNANGKCYRVTSLGLLAAMQASPVEIGTLIHVMVIGY